MAPGKIPRRGHQEREDDGRLGIAGGKPGQPLLAAHDPPPVGNDVGETAGQSPGLLGLAAVEGDGFGVFPYPHQGVPEVGLVALLEEVEADQRAADVVGEQRAESGVEHGGPEHGARHLDVEDVDVAGKLPEDDGKGDQGDRGFEETEGQGEGLLDEAADILADALVGVVGRAVFEAQPVVVAPFEPFCGVAVGEPAPPADLQHLAQVDLVDGHDDEQAGQDGEPAEQPEEVIDVFFLKRVVEKVVPFVEKHVEIDDAKAHADDHGKEQAGFEAFLGAPVGLGKRPQVGEKAPPGSGHGQGSFWGLRPVRARADRPPLVARGAGGNRAAARET